MAITLDWSNLRSWEGSQNRAFEELCCQLAAHEEMPTGSKFIRKGAPDAGVECYWVLPNGSECAWQAKFFRVRPGPTQWSQLDESVDRALIKHPNLRTYVVCMPIDREDPRKENQEWFMDKWNERVEKWKSQTAKLGRDVEFPFWGQHEIAERLAREEHHGRCLFWFDKDILSTQSMCNQISDVIANVGPRYTPKLNVELDIWGAFETIGRTEAFHNEVRKSIGQLRKSVQEVVRLNDRAPFGSIPSEIEKKTGLLVERFRYLADCAVNAIDLNDTRECLNSAVKLCSDLERAIHDLKAKGKAFLKGRHQTPGTVPDRPNHDYVIHSCRKVENALYELYRYVNEGVSRLAVNPAMVLKGSAGVGKTHLLCDIARRRTENDLPTVLLLGQNFQAGDLWRQMIDQLQFSCQTSDELLGILDAAGEAAGSRALILIDAINESQARDNWPNHLAGILNAVARYPWVGIVLSIRESYLGYMIPQHLYEQSKVVVMSHQGFSGEEYRAARTFFDYYGIEYPSIPLLNPEFTNPQFLGLLCKGLHNRRLHALPRGAHHATWVYECLIDSVNEKLARPENLDYDSQRKVVQEVVSSLARAMSCRKQTWLQRDEAKGIVDAILPTTGYHKSLFKLLAAEGVISEDVRPKERGYVPIIRFAYDRLSDHLIAKFMLEEHLDPDSPQDAFDPSKPIGSLFTDESTCWYNRGLVDALSIRIPEIVSTELPFLAPKAAGWFPVQEAFLGSLIWRDPTAVTAQTHEYFATHVVPNLELREELLETLLTVAVIHNHPFNADFLHARLIDKAMPMRDASWSTAIHGERGRRGAVDRLIDWAWSEEDKSHIEDEALRLAAVALSWFLTSSNRFLRDHATKALVALLTNRIPVLRKLLHSFRGVDDPYVCERLYAVAYGCALRTVDRSKVVDLARDVHELVFKEGTPPPNISLRDYAQGVVEFALHVDPTLDIDPSSIGPPYHSEWPEDIPSLADVRAKYKIDYEKETSEADRAQGRIVFSVTEWDFQRYVIQSSIGYERWTSDRIGVARERTNREIHDDFLVSLTPSQKEAWDRLERVRRRVQRLGMPIFDAKNLALLLQGSKNPVFQKALVLAEERFTEKLTCAQRNLFMEKIKALIEDSRLLNQRNWFPFSTATAFVLDRVFTLGWDKELLGRFDYNITAYERSTRDEHKAERMGKKYQWIALRELLARVSDNFEYHGGFGAEPEPFEGAWQVSRARDIDPSCVIRGKGEKTPSSQPWWAAVVYNQWDEPRDQTEWLRLTTDLPPVETLVSVRDGAGVPWLLLESHQEWQEPTPPEEDRYDVPARRLGLSLSSYLVKRADISVFLDWAQEQETWGHWMPSSEHGPDIFLGEFFWAPSFKYHDVPDLSRSGWKSGLVEPGRLPCEVLVTADRYFSESGYDCSTREPFTILLPCRTVVEDLNLAWMGDEGKWFDAEGVLVASDPSVDHTGPNSLLIRRDTFERYLDEKEYELVWLINGGKLILGGRHWVGGYRGQLCVTGVAWVEGAQLRSHLNCRFDPPEKPGNTGEC